MHQSRVAAGLLPAGVLLAMILPGCRQQEPKEPGAGVAAPEGARLAARKWSATFPKQVAQAPPLASVGAYREGAVPVNFESLSPLLIEPSPSGSWNVLTAQARQGGPVVFRDDKPGLVRNPDANARPFYKRAEGAISALAWVDEPFADVRVTVRVNLTGGRDGKGAVSRQGPMARWDKGSNFLWCPIDFSSGTITVVRAQTFGSIRDVEGSEKPIKDFGAEKAYDVVMDVVGATVRCTVRQGDATLADTGDIKDPGPQVRGVGGVLIEPALKRSFDPLEGSFDQLTAVELTR